MPSRFADIAIPGVPKDTLSYAVPDGLSAITVPGKRALVPLGKRLVTGFIVKVHEQRPDFSVKVLQEVLDAQPVVTADVRQLCSWMRTYYACTLGDALKATLPQGMSMESERHVMLRSNDAADIDRAVGRSKLRRSIIDALLTGEIVTETALKKHTGARSLSAPLRELAEAGIIAVESVLEAPKAKVKTVNAVQLLHPWTREEKMNELMELLEKRAPRQVNVLAVLWQAYRRGQNSIPMPALVKASRGSTAQVRSLEEKQIVEVVETEVAREFTSTYEEFDRDITLTPAQEQVLEVVRSDMDASAFRVSLLYGVTASGKTQVYIEAIRHVLDSGKNALVLVPEISLTPQFVYRFRRAFGADVAVMHSRMSIGERFDAWRLTLEGRYRIVVGVRSAVFAPLENIGLVVVDEEHESSYKQSDTVPRYHARDVAVLRASLARAPALLGSATPSAESWQNAAVGKYRLLQLQERVDGASLPGITMVDIREARRQGLVHGSYSQQLIDAVRTRTGQGEASIVFQNRRGYAPHIDCRDCSHVPECPNCSISLTYHKDRNLLRCHYCGATERVPVVCPRCGGEDLERVGSGTQRIEEELTEALPGTRVLRMDLDTTRRKGAHDLMLTSFANGEYDVLLGTQMVAKGLDFSHVTLVGVVAAEQSLLLPDFRAAERTMQLLTQVAGRSGRGEKRGEVLLQSAQPDHPVFTRVRQHDYTGFITAELESRRQLGYPPFSRIVLLNFTGEKEEQVQRVARLFHESFGREEPFFRMYQPQPALIARINRRWRWQLLLRVDKARDPSGSMFAAAVRRADIYRLGNGGGAVQIHVDVDPHSFF